MTAARQDPLELILRRIGACPEAFPWAARYATLEELWSACDAPDWMLWALDAFHYAGAPRLRLFAVACAARVQALWTDPEAARAIDVATRFASGYASAADLALAHRAVRRARAAVVDRPDYAESMCAAATAVLSCTSDLAIEAAMDASRESARAVMWDVSVAGSWPEEGVWQANELRRIIGDDIHPLIAEVRREARRVLPLAT